MLTKPVVKRATTATRFGCVRRELGRYKLFSWHSSNRAAKDDLPVYCSSTLGQDQRHRETNLQEQSTCHCSSGEPLHYRRQASDSELLISWVSPDEASRPWHIRSRAVGAHIGRSVSRAIRDEWLCADVAECTIINVHKPPRSWLTPTAKSTSPHPRLYADGFNCQHVNWCCSKQFPDSESLASGAIANNLGLLHKPERVVNFSHQWNVWAPTRIWSSRVSAMTTDCLTDTSRKIPTVTTHTLSHSATEVHDARLWRSCETL